MLSVTENSLEVEIRREQGLNSLFAQLSTQGIQVLSMRNKANRLEELFVSMSLNKGKQSEQEGDK